MKFQGRKFRHELKFYINYKDYWLLKGRLKHVLKLDSNANEKGEYFIRSLYFDDIYDTALFEKNFGVCRRAKYRIRTYNMSDKFIKLEKKSKIGAYISKESTSITREEYNLIMNNDLSFLKDSESILKKDYYIAMRNKLLRPKVIVDYEREAYISDISEVRITFDKQLRVAMNSNDIFNPNLATQCLIPMPTMILEVKFNEFLPNVVRNMLNVEAREFTAISKYVFCRVQKNNI